MKLIPLLLALMIVPAQALVTDLESEPPADFAEFSEMALPKDSLVEVALPTKHGEEGADVHELLKEATRLLECEVGFPISITGYGATVTNEDEGVASYLRTHILERWHVNRTAVYETIQEPVLPLGLLADLSPVFREVTVFAGWDIERWLEKKEWTVRYDVAWEADYIEVEEKELDAFVSLEVLERLDLPTRVPQLLCNGEVIHDDIPNLDEERFEAYHQHVYGVMLEDRYARGMHFYGHHYHDHGVGRDGYHGDGYHGDGYHGHHGHGYHGHHGNRSYHGHHHFMHSSGWHARVVDVDARLATAEDKQTLHGKAVHHHYLSLSRLLERACEEVAEFTEHANSTLAPTLVEDQVTTHGSDAASQSGDIRVNPFVPVGAIGTGFLLFFTRKFW